MEWIDVEYGDKMPEMLEVVLGCDVYSEIISLARHLGGGFFELMDIDGIESDTCITHWMPLPELPKEDLS